jgi:hypothetical protein
MEMHIDRAEAWKRPVYVGPHGKTRDGAQTRLAAITIRHISDNYQLSKGQQNEGQ